MRLHTRQNDTVSRIGYCGDGIVNYTRAGVLDECDNGASSNWSCNGCTPDCKIFVDTCGDGILCGQGACEPSIIGQDDAHCDFDCSPRICGDGYLNTAAGEICDEVSATCDVDCTPTVCGDGVVNPLAGEECDDGGIDTWSCNANCTKTRCGDNYINTLFGEVCDDGDTDNCATPGCNSVCRGPAYKGTCGDGVLNNECGEEVCDDGARNGQCGFCSVDCQTAATSTCGDGVMEGCEVCDDGNTIDGDGCRGDCGKVEICGDSIVDSGEFCDDGDTAMCGGNCLSDCSALRAEVCGNGIKETCEFCEDSDPTNMGADLGCIDPTKPNCNNCGSCSADVCGDNIIGPSEVCDPLGECSSPEMATCKIGDLSACDVGADCRFFEADCAASCTRIVTCGDGFIDGLESCDDGNIVDNDGCSSTCLTE